VQQLNISLKLKLLLNADEQCSMDTALAFTLILLFLNAVITISTLYNLAGFCIRTSADHLAVVLGVCFFLQLDSLEALGLIRQTEQPGRSVANNSN